MKFWLSIAVYVAMAAVIGWGILVAVSAGGKPWLLVVALLAYLVIMTRAGCSETH